MKMSWKKADLENPAVVAAIVAMFDTAPVGFMSVHGLELKTVKGQVANYVFVKGANYANTVANSLAMLYAIEADPAFSITVKRNVWQNAVGEVSPTGCESKAFGIRGVKVQTYTKKDPALLGALARIHKSLICPDAPTKVWKKLGNAVYQEEDKKLDDGSIVKGKIFLRDLRRISKKILVQGEVKPKVSKEEIAVADAIKRGMPIGNYRMFDLSQNFQSIVLGGMEIVQEDAPEVMPEINVPQVKDDAAAPVALTPAEAVLAFAREYAAKLELQEQED